MMVKKHFCLLNFPFIYFINTSHSISGKYADGVDRIVKSIEHTYIHTYVHEIENLQCKSLNLFDI